MANIYQIFKKEFRSYVNSPAAYIFIIVFLVLTSWLFFRGFFLINQAVLRDFFSLTPWLFLFFIPAVTMRLWAEEKKLGTLEILMTLPIKDHEAVLGKFFAAFALLAVAIILTFPLPLTVVNISDPNIGVDMGPIVGGYLGILLLGAAYLAIGLFASSLTENQIVAFIVGVTLSFVLFIIGETIVLFSIPSALVPVFDFLGLGTHFENISRGVIDTRDVVYYLSVIAFFLFLNIRSVERRKWA